MNSSMPANPCLAWLTVRWRSGELRADSAFFCGGGVNPLSPGMRMGGAKTSHCAMAPSIRRRSLLSASPSVSICHASCAFMDAHLRTRKP